MTNTKKTSTWVLNFFLYWSITPASTVHSTPLLIFIVLKLVADNPTDLQNSMEASELLNNEYKNVTISKEISVWCSNTTQTNSLICTTQKLY